VNTDDTFDLLMKIAAYDQRTIGDGDVLAWQEALGDVVLGEALEAVTAFERSETAQRRRIIPADVVQWVAWSRRQVVEERHTEAELERSRAKALASWGAEPARALPPGGIVGSDPTGGRNESALLRALWDETLPAPCPPKPKGCGSEPGQRCLNPYTGLTTKIPHPARMRDAAASS